MTKDGISLIWLRILLLSVFIIVACILYADQSLADFFEAHVRHTGFWNVMNRALPVLDVAVGAALVFLIVCGIRVLSGHSLQPWTRTPLLCSWSAMWAVAADLILKHIFGRWGPDAGYIHQLYGFHLLHGDMQRAAFPSGTAAISSAIFSVLWALHPRSRAAGLVIIVVLSAIVVIMNYHWLSDAIAGAFLGVFVGFSTVRLYGEGNSANE